MASSTPGRDLVTIISFGTTIGMVLALYGRLNVSIYLIEIGVVVVAILTFFLRLVPGVAKFLVLVVTIERREATVVEATVAPDVLAMLMKDPNEMGKTLTDDAALNYNQEPIP